jgi:hypothetical protein
MNTAVKAARANTGHDLLVRILSLPLAVLNATRIQ